MVWEKWPCKGQPKAGGSEYLELHGAFSITLHAPGAELLSKVWFPCSARQRMKKNPRFFCSASDERDLLGALLIAEEALTPAVVIRLTELLSTQPGWSDLLVIIVTLGGEETAQSMEHQHR